MSSSLVPESRQIKGLVGRIGGFGLEPRKFNVLLFGWVRVYNLQWDRGDELRITVVHRGVRSS